MSSQHDMRLSTASMLRAAGTLPNIAPVDVGTISAMQSVSSLLQDAVRAPGMASLTSSTSVAASVASMLRAAGTLPNTAPVFAEIDKQEFKVLVESIRKDEERFEVLDFERQFNKLPDSETLLVNAASELDLTVPFTHDSAVRVALQIVIATIFTALMLYLVGTVPITSSVLQVVGGAPTAVGSWKVVGAAYDKLYDKKNYHPQENGRPFRPPSRRRSGKRDAW